MIYYLVIEPVVYTDNLFAVTLIVSSGWPMKVPKIPATEAQKKSHTHLSILFN